jgi:hypothetical protein
MHIAMHANPNPQRLLDRPVLTLLDLLKLRLLDLLLLRLAVLSLVFSIAFSLTIFSLPAALSSCLRQ